MTGYDTSQDDPIFANSGDPRVARKDDQEKLRFDLIPGQPLEELAKVYTIGAKKYADRNYAEGDGLSWMRVYGALIRHANAFLLGESIDPDDGQHHLASVAWCAFTLMELEEIRPQGDDRPVVREAAAVAKKEVEEYFLRRLAVPGWRGPKQ